MKEPGQLHSQIFIELEHFVYTRYQHIAYPGYNLIHSMSTTFPLSYRQKTADANFIFLSGSLCNYAHLHSI